MNIPANFFSMVLGLVGLGSAWRAASALWGLPALAGEIVMAFAVALWALLLALYLRKWFAAREAALAEWRHPVQGCFVSLAAVATLLAAIACAPWSRETALVLFVLGVAGQLLLGAARSGALWRGARDPTHVTPAMYLPLVAGNLVTAMAAGALGFASLGHVFFGAGVFAWLALESVVLRRLLMEPPLPAALRPTLGIQLAPPVVACVAWISVNGEPDMFARALFGYGLLQFALLARLSPWLAEAPFAANWWAYSFGIAALAITALRLAAADLDGVEAWLALPLFAFANLFIGALVIGSLRLLARGKLIPA